MNWDKKFTKIIGSRASVFFHTIFFAFMLVLPLFGAPLDTVLLILTTLVSLEAIYLAIFIQMTVNEHTESLHEVEEDIEEIQENVEEISTDIDEIESGLEEIQSEAIEEKKAGGDLHGIRSLLHKLVEEVDRLKHLH